MGSSSSKPARKLGEQATSQTLRQGTASRPPGAGQTAPRRPPQPQEVGAQAGRFAPPAAQTSPAEAYSESKSNAVRHDGQDPQLLANLQKLGQVQVPRGKVKYKQSNPMLTILAARQKNTEMEEEANTSAQRSSGGVNNAGTMRNRLNAPTIVALLDQRKECRTQRDVEALAVSYDIDLAVLDQLARLVNSPSVEAGARLRERKPVAVEDDEGLPQRVDAVWTEPALSDVREIRH